MKAPEEEIPLKQAWESLLTRLETIFGKRPDLNGVLFLIGVQELGQGVRRFSKEEKQDLMHIATCKVLSYGGFYKLEGIDRDGWPHWTPTQPLPFLSLRMQEELLKEYIIEYFRREVFPDL
ncbi:MAG: hypothetical protein RMJ44_02825 [Cytophagales bacterium]|nr:hypothetical protein [Bernardetiaceae bacterium]MDW8209996.1 hypothetical protein [Cytophagales bacterium]